VVRGPSKPSGKGVLRAPIKNGPFPNNPKGNIQNVPRDLLPGIVRRTGDPAAVNELGRVENRPVLYVPEEYSGPRQQTPEEYPPVAIPHSSNGNGIHVLANGEEAPVEPMQAVKPKSNGNGFKSNKTIVDEKQPSQYRGVNGTAESDKLADALMAKGYDRNKAYQQAEEIEHKLANPDKYYKGEVEAARNIKKMAFGPERRSAPRK
jgi:hypothetical protein